MRKMNLDTDFIPLTKTNSKWIIDTNIKCKNIRPQEDNVQKETYINLGMRMTFRYNTKSSIHERKH